jgi:DNA-binding transcriptional ArsR family regulator
MAMNSPSILTPIAAIRVALEPVHNVLSSLKVLHISKEYSGLSQWVYETTTALSEERTHLNNLILSCFWDAVMTDSSRSGFVAYLDDLMNQDPTSLRDRVLNKLRQIARKKAIQFEERAFPTNDELIEDRALYLNLIEKLHHGKDALCDRDLFTEAHALLKKSTTLHKTITTHLRWMWEKCLAPEWDRTRPMLEKSVEAFQKICLEKLSPLEAVRIVVGRDLRTHDYDTDLNHAEEIIFVPSVHVGPYVIVLKSEKTIWIAFGARVPEGVPARSAALTRSELLVRLTALADETRLHILELLKEHGELSSQEVMDRLRLSQSSASRHLIQLCATSFLLERRQERTKYYRINPEKLDSVSLALQSFLSAH